MSVNVAVDIDDLMTRIAEVVGEEAGLDAAQIAPDTQLVSSGLLDSFALVTILMIIEEQTGQALEPELLTLDNFDSLGRMSTFLRATVA